MPFWNRKKDPEPVRDDGWRLPPVTPPQPVYTPPAVATAPEPPAPNGLVVSPNGDMEVRVSSVADAKLAIKQLRLKKKELALEKKVVAAEMTEIRADRRTQVGRQGSMTRGGGDFGKVARAVQRTSRDMARSRHANRLAPLDDEKQRIDTARHRIDTLILDLEHYILAQEQLEATPLITDDDVDVSDIYAEDAR